MNTFEICSSSNRNDNNCFVRTDSLLLLCLLLCIQKQNSVSVSRCVLGDRLDRGPQVPLSAGVLFKCQAMDQSRDLHVIILCVNTLPSELFIFDCQLFEPEIVTRLIPKPAITYDVKVQVVFFLED